MAHPQLFPGVPAAGAMEKKKPVADLIPVLIIQLFDFTAGQPRQRFVLRQYLLVRVSKISQKGKVEVVVPIRQEPNFQRLGQVIDVFIAHEHCRDHNKRPRFRRNPAGEIQTRERMRSRKQGHRPIHKRDRQVGRA